MVRAYGALWDALGLAPAREFEKSARQFTSASLEQAAAQGRYSWVSACAWGQGTQRFVTEVVAGMTGRAAADVTSTALLRQWIDALDAATHDAMLSDAGLEATAATVRASSRRRLAQQRLVDLGAEGAGLPTRREMDEAFREIQEIKRELRRLRDRRARKAKEASNA